MTEMVHWTFSWLLIDPDIGVHWDLGFFLFYPACDFLLALILSLRMIIVSSSAFQVWGHNTSMIFMITYSFIIWKILKTTKTVMEVTQSDITKWFFQSGNINKK